MENAKAIAGALTTLIVFVVAEIGLDLPDGVVAAMGTVLTGGIVWYVTNRKPQPPATLEGVGRRS